MQKHETAHLSDLLVRVAMHRDKAAFGALFNHFAPRVKSFGIKQFNNEALAMELVQETMTLVWRKAHMYNSERGAATTWVYTLMRNTSFDMLRKLKLGREEHLSDDIWPLISDDSETDEERDFMAEKYLRGYVSRLPAKQQEVVKGVYFNELTQEQLAKQLDVPIGTVKSRLRLALTKLRQFIGGDDD